MNVCHLLGAGFCCRLFVKRMFHVGFYEGSVGECRTVWGSFLGDP